MPNRIIKESAFTSDKISQLSDFEFRLWVGLITQADDAGRGDARPAIIKGRVFALRERTAVKDIENALLALAAHGCVSLYTVDGKPYYEFPHWAAHQRVRDAKPKYPGTDEADVLPQSAASCGESQRDAALIQSNPIQSESKSESKSESNASAGARNDAFDRFWSVYPKKVGKEAARKAFAKVKAPVTVLIAAIEQQKNSRQWKKENGQYIPNPATWLNQGRWEDEVPGQAPKVYRGGDFFDDD